MNNSDWLTVENADKSFGGVLALSDFSCSLRQSEILGLIGPNGAGKSTLFNVITGFLRPDRGKIEFKGRNLVGLPAHRIATIGISRTFQNLRLIRQLSVLENVLLCFSSQPGERIGNVFFRWAKCRAREKNISEAAFSLLKTAGLEDKIYEPADALSYGQQKLLSIVCCLAGKADMLLLDEPVAGIAPAMAEKILSVICNLPGQGRSVIIIEHNMDVIAQICGRVIFMDSGSVVSEGSPEDVRNDPQVIKAYLA